MMADLLAKCITVVQELVKIDVNELLGTAGNAVTDEKARRKLLSSATDAALDFVLKILPSMSVPPFEGVKDGLLYRISNLSMQGFWLKVRKEDIQIELAGMRATRRHESSTDEKKQSESPGAGGSESGESDETSIRNLASFDSFDSAMQVEELQGKVKATEVLIIDIKGISAILDDAAWSFEQTYLPYLKGKGLANVKLSDGAIRLKFELRRRRKATTDGNPEEWEPVLSLNDRTCTISDVDISLQGEGTVTWIVNKLATVFKGPLRDFVVNTILRMLTSESGWILARLNTDLAPYWDLILSSAKLNMVSVDRMVVSIERSLTFFLFQDDLMEADDNMVVCVTETEPEEEKKLELVELVWRERLPLGMNLLMNDESGLIKVVDFPRGSQARSVCEKRGFDADTFKGAALLGVNGYEYDDQDDQEEVFEALKDPGRPKTVRFLLPATEDAERVRKFVEGSGKDKEGTCSSRNLDCATGSDE
jgi:hypothetical protein